MSNDHVIYAATVQQIAGLELEREAHLEQIAGLVAERDALRLEVYRAEYSANEYRRALDHVRGILAGGRTVGHDHSEAALAAENFIIAMFEEAA